MGRLTFRAFAGILVLLVWAIAVLVGVWRGTYQADDLLGSAVVLILGAAFGVARTKQ